MLLSQINRHCTQREKEDKKVGYWITIPASVLKDNKISDKAKILYGHISGLIGYSKEVGLGYCWASNQYFATEMGTAKSNISRLITQLKDAGHIDTHITYKPNSKEVSQRYIMLDPIARPSAEDIKAFLDEESKEREETDLLNILKNG